MAPTTRQARVRGRVGKVLRVAVVGLVTVALLGGLLAYRLVGVAHDLRGARDLIEEAATLLEDGQVGAAADRLEQAERLLVAANSELRIRPEISVLGGLPVLSANVESLRSSVSLALLLAASGVSILRSGQQLAGPDGRLEIPLRQGSIPLDILHESRLGVENLLGELPGADEYPSERWLISSVAAVQRRVTSEALERRAQLEVLAHGLGLLEELAGGRGPRRYLLAVSNSAEMRGSGGMYLSYGVLEGHAGDFELSAFGGIDELFLAAGEQPDAPALPADEAGRWQGLEPLRLWRNANLVPDLQIVGPRLVAMYRQATGLEVDGVVQIDADGLAGVLEGVGPVVVEGVGRVDASNVVDIALNRAYVDFPDRDQRQEVLGDVAEATFDRLVEGEYDSIRTLAEALARAGNERHIMVWSARPAIDSSLSFFGIDGELPAPTAEHALLTVQNLGRNKLDYYLDTALSLTGSRRPGSASDVVAVVVLGNTAPDPETLPEYVVGDGEVAEPGDYVRVGSLYVPNGTVLVDASGARARLQSEGGRTVVGFDVSVPPGTTRTIELSLSFPARPPGPYRLALVPIPRVRPTLITIDLETGDGTATRSGALVTPEVVGCC